MKLEIVKSEGLAHNSYLLTDEVETAVIDPRRDCEIYAQLAEKECAKIKYILETHRNEDYVAGSLELRNITEAEIGHSNALSFKYGEHNLTDSDVLDVGNVKIKALNTPGHTNELSAILLINLEAVKPRWFSQATHCSQAPWDELTYTAKQPRRHKPKNSTRA
jgi:hydroxyacylglutathione hydrolase